MPRMGTMALPVRSNCEMMEARSVLGDSKCGDGGRGDIPQRRRCELFTGTAHLFTAALLVHPKGWEEFRR